MHGVFRIFLTVTMGGTAPAGHVFIVSPEAPISVDPASQSLNACCFEGCLHHDFFFRHDFVLAAIAADFEGGLQR